MTAWPASRNRVPTNTGDITDPDVNQRHTFSATGTPANSLSYVYIQNDVPDSPEYPPPRSISPPSSTTRSSTDTPTSRTLSTSPPTHVTPPSSTSSPVCIPQIHSRTTPPSGTIPRSSVSPPSKAVYAQISPLLSYPTDGYSSPFPYNLTYPLQSSWSMVADPHLYDDPVLLEEIKREPAFKAMPSLSQVTIVCSRLPEAHQQFVIDSQNKPLSVFDVMDGIHNHLRTKLTEDDCRSLRLNWALVRQEMDSRLDRIPDVGHYDAEAERRRGVISLDLLGGKRRFLGLSSTAEGYGVWKLHTF